MMGQDVESNLLDDRVLASIYLRHAVRVCEELIHDSRSCHHAFRSRKSNSASFLCVGQTGSNELYLYATMSEGMLLDGRKGGSRKVGQLFQNEH
jgi:hypothetical protein